MLAIEFRRGCAARKELDFRLVHSNAYYLTVASFLNRETNSMKAPNGADFRALRVANTAKLRMCLRQRGVAEKRDSDNGDLEVDYIRI
jgi:hypothetical protein